MKTILNASIFICLIGFSPAWAANVYLRSSGNDAATGASYAQAWKTITRLNSANLKGSDTVFFEGGQVFSGEIYLDPEDGGTDSKPLVLASFGAGKAIINAGEGKGLLVYNTSGIEIRDLEFKGSGTSTNKSDGLYFYTDLKNGQKLEYIRVDQVNIHGFGKSGLCIGSWDASYPGFKDVVISNVKSYDNETGMSSYDMADWKSDKYAHKNILIRDCELLNSISSGIVLCGIDSGIVEYCRASNTGATGKGVVGLWAWSCRNLIFQYCTVDGTVTSGPDGGGFDLDGGTESCIVQYCYTYNNAGPGYMHCDYPYSRPTRKNIIRYCLSENDGRKPADNRCSFLFISWGNGLHDCEMYNNTAYITSNGAYSVYGFWGYIMFGNGDAPHITNCSARNNIFYVKGDHHFLANLDGGSTPISPSNLILQGNCYFAEGNGSTRWINNGTVYPTLDTWQVGSGQEMLLQKKTGFNIDPMFKNPGKAGIISPRDLANITAYQLEANSPLIDSGLGVGNFTPTVMTDPDNGGFESKFAGWNKIGSVSYIDIDSSNTYEGKYSVRLGNNTCGILSNTMAVNPLNIVTSNSFIKCDNANSSATAFIRFYDSENKLLLESTTKTTDNSWSGKYIYTIAPALAKYVKYGVRRDQNSTNGNIYLDAITIDLNAAGPKMKKDPLCNIDQYMQPFWTTDTTWNETVLMLSTNGQPATGRLLFQPTKLLSVKSFDLKNTYLSGIDFTVTDNSITRTSGSQMPFTTDASFSKANLAWYEIQSQWVVVTYTHQRTWNGPVPKYKGELLPNTIRMLQSKAPLRIAAYGMSITRGMDVSGFNDVPPFMPTYYEMFVDRLKKIYGYDDIALFNAGFPGSTAKWGAENTGLYISPLNPDLVILDFGMNDFWSVSPANFKAYIQTIMNNIKTGNPNVEFILLTNMFFDPEYILQSDSYYVFYNDNMKGYVPVLKGLEKSGVVNVDIATISDTLYHRKKAKDCLANPLHPNDYMARWYAQSMVAAFVNDNVSASHDSYNTNDPLFKVFPNPSYGSLYIENNYRNNADCFVTISNLLGQEFKRIMLYSNKMTINTNDLSRGLYLISLNNKDDGLLITQRFLIE